MRLCLALVVASGVSCARARPSALPDPWPARMASADAEATAGCYRCLATAVDTYDAALAAGRDVVGPRAYRVAVLAAIRERLLGLYPGAYQEAPARLRTFASPDDAAMVDDVLPVLPWRRGTMSSLGPSPRGEDLSRLRSRRALLEAQADADPWHATLLLALVGSHPFLALEEGERPPPGVMPGLEPDTWRARHPDDPGLAFTRLVLLRGSIDDLDAFRAAQPRFVEVAAVRGEAELGRGRLVSAEEAFLEALEAFPDLVPARALRADVRQRMEDFETAVAEYDALLARVPEHREALLGRLKSLGFIGRHEDAIAEADRLLTLGTWYLGEAHYWKAWNLFSLARLDAARGEVDAARSLLVNADLHYLGGVIAFRQQRLDDAQRDLDAAIELEGRHCEAHFDRAALGLVRRDWADAGARFDQAFECLAARTGTLEQRIADAREARLPDQARSALVSRREWALLAHRHQMAWARYNGAVAYANVGKTADARARAVEAIAIGGQAAEAAQRLLPQLSP